MNKNIRSDFPIFEHKMSGNPLIYFDSASTTQKPRAVIDALANFYSAHNANIHRGIYTLAEQATELYENARASVAKFINADPSEIVFTRGTTESINLVASTWGKQNIGEGDGILITELEHHSNLLPWQQLALERKAHLYYIPVLADGRLDLAPLPELLKKNIKLVAISHVSNALGVHNGIKDIIDAAHKIGARVLIDAAQSVPHQPVDTQKMKCDFLAFSGHKILGPTGIGILYITKELHERMPPYQLGGGMVYETDFYHAKWRKAPHKFEAGTPAIAQAIGLQAAIEYLQKNVDWATLREHEAHLCAQLIDGLLSIPAVRILGPIDELKKVGHMVTFTMDGYHAHDIAAYLDRFGICVRAGHHCAQPLAKKLGLDSSVRVSFYLYNTEQEVEYLIKVLRDMKL